ncbi:RNA polymerase sigma-70 factor [Zhouia sp. PK063]|uniref:RNA polymerase sigma-70 factor n=1 Tax=Zhouia sp. PK063 TaxID=3373602 RepID=UPI0037B14844
MKANFSYLTDTELLAHCKKNNVSSFDEIYNRYWKRLFTYAFKIYQDDLICEDIVQEVFIKLWEINQTTTILNLEAYLFKAIKNRAANHIRSLKFTAVHEDVLTSIQSTINLQKEIEVKELEQQIFESIDELPPKCKEIFYMSRFEMLNNKEIAEKLNISIRTVEKHISNALKHLRQQVPYLQIIIYITLMLYKS